MKVEAASVEVKQEAGVRNGKGTEVGQDERSEVKEEGDARSKVKEEKGLPLVSNNFGLLFFCHLYDMIK